MTVEPGPALNFKRLTLPTSQPTEEAAPTPVEAVEETRSQRIVSAPVSEASEATPPSRPPRRSRVEVDNPMIAGINDYDPSQDPLLGKRKLRPHKRRSRFVLRDDYMAILLWTDKARYTTVQQVSVFLEVGEQKARRMMETLEAKGYLASKEYSGFFRAYFLTATAKDVVESNTDPVKKSTGPQTVRHTLTLGWIMLTFLKEQGSLSEAMTKALGRPIELDDFVSESELSRAVARKKSATFEQLERRAAEHSARRFIPDWEVRDELARAASKVTPADELDPEALWAWACHAVGGQPHQPDLILRVPRAADGKPLSIAFEAELSRKPESTGQIVSSYGGYVAMAGNVSPSARYRTVAWVCGGEAVKKIVDARKDEGHQSQLREVFLRWVVPFRDGIEDAVDDSKERNRAAREAGLWHVTTTRAVLPCKCGVACQSRYGQFTSREEALELADELA